MAGRRRSFWAWQEQFPAAKLDGYLTLLAARYWAERSLGPSRRPGRATAHGHPDSPYADQALYLAAESQMFLGQRDLALGTLQMILKEYPGSPLVAKVKVNLETLERERESGGGDLGDFGIWGFRDFGQLVTAEREKSSPPWRSAQKP